MDLRLPPELPLSFLLGLLFDRSVPPASPAPSNAPCQCQCACLGANGTEVSSAGSSWGPSPRSSSGSASAFSGHAWPSACCAPSVPCRLPGQQASVGPTWPQPRARFHGWAAVMLPVVDQGALDYAVEQGWSVATDSEEYTVLAAELEGAPVLMCLVAAEGSNFIVAVPGSAATTLTEVGIGFSSHMVRLATLRNRGRPAVARVAVCLLQMPLESVLGSNEAALAQAMPGASTFARDGRSLPFSGDLGAAVLEVPPVADDNDVEVVAPQNEP